MKKNIIRRTMVLGMALTLLCSLCACGSKDAKSDQKSKVDTSDDKTFVAALAFMPDSIDPTNLMNAADMHATRNCYEPLVEEVRGTTDLEPWLAEEWEIPDAKTYIFHILDGVKFYDGTNLDAEAVVYTFERAMAFVNSVSSCVEEIETVEATDDMTVKITLKAENSGFLYNVAKIGIISPEFCKKHEEDGDWAQKYLKKHSCGTGAYQVTDYVDDQYVTLSKFDDYWQGWKENQIDVVQTLIVKDNATQIQMLNSGEVDKLQIPLTENLDMLEKNPKIQILKGGSLQTNIFTFNMQKAPFDNPKVRQAVSYAFDYEGVKNNVYNGQATVPSGFMPANFAEHNENIPEQKQDIEKAKQLMKESGVGSCEIKVHLCEGSDDQVQMAQILQANLAEIGITVKIEIMPWTSLVEENTSPETAPEMSALNMGAFTGDAAFFLKQNFHSINSGGSYNWSFYEKPEFDKLLNDAAATVDTDKKTELLKQAQQMLVDDCVAVFAASPNTVEAINNTYKGYVLHPLDYFYSIRFYQLTVDK